MFSFFRRKPADDAGASGDAPVAPDDGAGRAERPRGAMEWLNADVGELLFRRKPAPREAATPTDSAALDGPPASPATAAPPATLAALAPPATLAPLAREDAGDAGDSGDSGDEDRSDWLGRLAAGLRRTGAGIADVLVGAELDDATLDDLEAALLQADAGAAATRHLLDDLQARVRRSHLGDARALRRLLAESLAELLAPLERPLVIGEHVPTVIMVAGVNGAGKTTTIGKLARHLLDARRQVLLAAADTFRAAAREQLMAWADRAGGAAGRIEIVSQQGGDPAGVSFDAVTAGKARGADVVIVDTAGRLATQAHLMDELKKIRRTIGKALPGAPHEVLLVIDGNTGQNALAQVQAFDAALDLTGLVITKLDGTAKGGVLAAIALWSQRRERPLPVYFIGVGEQLADLQTFRAREFAQALVG